MSKLKPHNPKHMVVIRYSCITGKPVWVYWAPSKGAAWTAYSRACKREAEVVRRAPEVAAQRKANIKALLSRCLESLPIGAELTPRQQAAAKELLALAEMEIPFSREFYDHVVEERRRRAEDAEIRRQMREREKQQNTNYGK